MPSSRTFDKEEWNMLSIDGNIHFVSRPYDEHLVWNTTTRKVQRGPIGLRDRDIAIMGQSAVRWGGTAVHIPSKNIILQLGGVANFGRETRTIVSDTWKGALGSNGRWKWEEIRARGHGMAALNAIVSADSKYVVISAVDNEDYPDSENEDDSGDRDEEIKWRQFVHVLDVQNLDGDGFKWRRTEIEIPLPKPPKGEEHEYWGKQLMFRTGNEHRTGLLVNGFVRRQYRTEQFEEVSLLPVVLIAMIQAYCSAELIHWVNEEFHAAIPLRDILSSPSEEC